MNLMMILRQLWNQRAANGWCGAQICAPLF